MEITHTVITSSIVEETSVASVSFELFFKVIAIVL